MLNRWMQPLEEAFENQLLKLSTLTLQTALVKEGVIEWLIRRLYYEEQEGSMYTENTIRYLENLPKPVNK